MTWHGGQDQEIPDFKVNEEVPVCQNKIIEGVT